MRAAVAEVKPAVAARTMAVRELSAAYGRHLEALGRKRTTLAGVESAQRVWIDRVLGDRQADDVGVEAVHQRLGKSPASSDWARVQPAATNSRSSSLREPS